MTPPSGGPNLGLAEAAKACGVSVSTLRRKRSDLKDLGAVETGNGWRIPVTALVALGLMGRTTDARHDGHHDSPVTPATTPATTPPPETPADTQLRELEQALAAERARADSAERLAASYRENLQDVRTALRMLEGGKSSPPEQPTEEGQSVPTELPVEPPAGQGGRSRGGPAEPSRGPRWKFWRR